MASQCYLKIRAINKNTFGMTINDAAGATQSFECSFDSVHELRFHFENKYSISFSLEVNSPFGFLTVNNVADFCWMVLNLISYFGESIQVLEARPDPVLMIRNAVDS